MAKTVNKILKIVAIVVVVIIIAVIILLNNLGRAIKAGIQTVGSQVTQCKITVDDVDLSLLRGKLLIKNLIVGNPEGYKTDNAFQLDKVNVSLQPKSIFSDLIVIDDIVIDGPQITYEVGLGNSNIGTIQKNVESWVPASEDKEEPEKKEEKEGGKKVQISHFLLDNGQINLSAKIMQGKDLSLPLPKIELNDIGKPKEDDKDAENGVAATAATALVLKNVLTSVSDTATEGLKSLGANIGEAGKSIIEAGKSVGESAKGALDAAKGALGDAKKSLGNLLKKD